MGYVVLPKGKPVAGAGEDYVSRQAARRTARILPRKGKGECSLWDARTVFPSSCSLGFWGGGGLRSVATDYGAPTAGGGEAVPVAGLPQSFAPASTYARTCCKRPRERARGGAWDVA